MRNVGPLLILAVVMALPISCFAEVDFDQEVLNIPDTHDEKPYIWNVAVNPKGYDLIVEHDDLAAGTESRFSIEVKRDPAQDIKELQVFIADSDLQTYRHLRPSLVSERYVFSFNPPRAENYRLEVVFRTDGKWIDLRKDIRVKSGQANQKDQKKDEGYSAKVKLIPRRVYAEHVVTFLFELKYEGIPIRNLEKMDGADMQLASWDEDLKEFMYAIPKQNLGGPEVAVSAVFRRPGRRAVFAEFKHNGAVHQVEMIIDVLMEPKQGTFIENLKPSD